MPWQGHLLIGEVVSNWDEVEAIHQKLGGKVAGPDDDPDEFYNCNPYNIPSRTITCLLYTSPSPRDRTRSRMPSSA